MLGFLSQEALTAELLATKALVAPSLGGESFGMVLTRGFACATPVVASDIDGYRDVMTPEIGAARPAGRPARPDGGGRSADRGRAAAEAFGAAARRVAIDKYSWEDIGRRLIDVYEQVLAA